MSRSIAVSEIVKTYPLPGGRRLAILRGATFTANEGETLAIMGVSGSGKTTLLNIIGGIDSSDSGSVIRPEGRPGFIFQMHYLIPELTALENIAIAARLAGASKPEAIERARRLLASVGLSERADHMPNELSGGEAARISIARALSANAPLILADEPTGNLDEETSETVQQLLFQTVKQHQKTMIIVTHDSRVAAKADRVLKLEHGVF